MKFSINSTYFFNFWKDSSLFSLLIANIVTLILALIQDWSLLILLWIFLGQSIIIGIFNFIKILSLKEFSVEGFKINGINPENNKKTKRFAAFFFLFHYGFFHLGYFSFLFFLSLENLFKSFLENGAINLIGIPLVLISLGTFLGHHWYSFLRNKSKGTLFRVEKPNIGTLMFFPYARIIPMHLILLSSGILFSLDSKLSMIIFLSLKTIADLIMHYVEHKTKKI